MSTFWWLLMMVVVAWYSVVTVYVAVRGAVDVRHMLRALEQRGRDDRDAGDPGDVGGGANV